MKKIAAFTLLFCSIAGAADKVQLGLFVDTYYAFDANQPPTRERAFTTLPTRHNEFALNLAFLEAKINADRLRGRFALQTGTSVYANYATEARDPARTGTQLADILQHVQEAYAGYRIADTLWIDAGIFLSHIGSESFVSRDNWTYTRSLVADFSPYYQAGVRLSYDPSPRWSFQLHVLNGWQNILENNHDKALGTQVSFRPNDRLTLTYNTFLGREGQLRFFQDFIVKYQLTPWWESALTVDVGLQGSATWFGTSFQNRIRLGEATHVAVRVESYSDPNRVIAHAAAGGVSGNVDVKLTPELLWRSEVRWLRSRDAVFASSAGPKTDTVFGITSLALSL